MPTETYLYSKEKTGGLAYKLTHEEFKCRCKSPLCYYTLVNRKILTRWYGLRQFMGIPLKVNSGYRCQSHNKNVGGSEESRHTSGSAVDIDYTDLHQVQRDKLKAKAREIFDVVIDYPDKNFIHCHMEPDND